MDRHTDTHPPRCRYRYTWLLIFSLGSLTISRRPHAPLALQSFSVLEKEMAIPSSILAWRISWTEEPGGFWSLGLQSVGHY